MRTKTKTNAIVGAGISGSLLCLLILSGCAVGNQYAYVVEDIGLPISGGEQAEALGVGAGDSRQYVLSGSKNPTFVGLQRGGFGNPFDVTTKSGRPFSNDVAQVVGGLLNKAGYPTRIKSDFESSDAFVMALKDSGLMKGVFIDIREWKTDIYMNITLHYDLQLTVFDNEGSVLAQAEQNGRDVIGGGKLSQSANAESASLALSTKISFLFNEASVQEALK